MHIEYFRSFIPNKLFRATPTALVFFVHWLQKEKRMKNRSPTDAVNQSASGWASYHGAASRYFSRALLARYLYPAASGARTGGRLRPHGFDQDGLWEQFFNETNQIT
jgi:hypothetical protein